MNVEKKIIEENLIVDVLSDLESILSIAVQIKPENLDYIEWNYNFTRIGNYAFIQKIKKMENDKTSDKFNISFEINNRLNPKEKFFEYNFLYEVSNKETNDFFRRIIDIYGKLSYEVPENESDEEQEKREKKNFKIFKELLKEFFKEKYKDLMKIINLIFKKEYGKKIKFKDINKEMFFNEDIDLEDDEKRIDFPFNDFYFLYYSINSKTKAMKILGLYSLPFPELYKENCNDETINCFILSDLIYYDIIENLENGYSLEECLMSEIYSFPLKKKKKNIKKSNIIYS